MTTWCLVYWPMQGHVQNSLLNKRRWFSFFLLFFLATRSMRRLQWRGLFKLLVPSPVFSSSTRFVWRFHRPQKVQSCWTDAFLRQWCFSIASVILLCFSSSSELKLEFPVLESSWQTDSSRRVLVFAGSLTKLTVSMCTLYASLACKFPVAVLLSTFISWQVILFRVCSCTELNLCAFEVKFYLSYFITKDMLLCLTQINKKQRNHWTLLQNKMTQGRWE